MQSKKSSLLESFINVFIGFIIAFIANLFILPLVGFTELTLEANLYISIFYMAISVLRSYIIRRWFNARIHSVANKMTESFK